MKQTVYEQDFVEAFDKMGRSDNFTVAGRRALFNALTEMEESTETEQELDVIGLCCQFSEYADFEEFKKDYTTDSETIDDLINSGYPWIIMVDENRFIIEEF